MPTYSEDILRLAEANMVPIVEGEPRVEMANRLCGDRVVVAAELSHARTLEIHWQAEGCAILKASATYLARTLRGKSAEAGLNAIEDFMKSFAADAAVLPQHPLAPIYRLPARYKCALLPWQACENLLREHR